MPIKSITFLNVDRTTTEVSRNSFTDVVQVVQYDQITGRESLRYVGRDENFDDLAHNLLIVAGIDTKTNEYQSGVTVLRSIMQDRKDPRIPKT